MVNDRTSEHENHAATFHPESLSVRGAEKAVPRKKPAKPPSEASSQLAADLKKFEDVAKRVKTELAPAVEFEERCQQAFDVANDLFGNAPTWVCFYRELLGGNGLVHTIFDNNIDFEKFLRTEQYHQIQMMLTALRSRDLPENDPNDPQRMITVRLPKSLHEAMCDEAGRLNISVNQLCISRMLQLLDPQMIPKANTKVRVPKSRQKVTEPASIGEQASFDGEDRIPRVDKAGEDEKPAAQEPTLEEAFLSNELNEIEEAFQELPEELLSDSEASRIVGKIKLLRLVRGE